MAISINNTNNIKNAVEINNELKATGKKCEFISAEIAGENRNIGFLVTENEAERKKAMEFFNYFSATSNGNVYEMAKKLMIIATINENGIEPDEMVEICGEDIIMSYFNGKAYDMDCNEIANCDDMPNLPKEAIKAILVARVEAILK